MSGGPPTRRAVLLGGAAVVGGLATAACSHPKAAPTVVASASASPSPSATPPDLEAATLAAALENLLIAVYDTAISAATDGRLGVVPAAAVSFLTTTREQHADHASAWNALLGQNHLPAVDGTPLAPAGALLRTAARAKTFAAFGAVAIEVEHIAVSTYLSSVTTAALESIVATGISIAPVEAEHAAALALLTGAPALTRPSGTGLWDVRGALSTTDITAAPGA